ncbi:MAG: hypothetical protein R2909_14870 [Gemmatimonadales bacterium]
MLFELVMERVPGALPGAGWADAWMVSLNNLLFSEIFFDVIDVFRLGLAPDPDHRLGQVLIFLTRGVLSVAFIRVIVQLFRAAYFRAHGLGRGVDLLAALRTAAEERPGRGPSRGRRALGGARRHDRGSGGAGTGRSRG